MVRIRIGGEERTLTWDEWEQHVRQGRVPKDAEVLFEPVTEDRWVLAGELEMYTSLQGDSPPASTVWTSAPIATALLVGINIRIWWTQLWIVPAADLVNTQCLAAHGAILEGGQGWRAIAMGFCHTDFMHIAANLLWMAFAGWGVERALGRRNLVAIFIGSVLAGSLLSIAFAPATAALGASGGVFGLVAAVIVLGFFRPQVLPDDRRGMYGFAMFPYLAIMFLGGWMDDNIANWAHFGGMVAGALLAAVLDPEHRQRRPRWNLGWQGLITALVALTIAIPLLVGPRVHLLVDASEARSAASRVPVQQDNSDSEAYRALTYAVPAGWRPGVNSAGDPSFRSTVPGSERFWTVSARTERRPLEDRELYARWRDRLERGHTDVRWTEPHAEIRSGHPGLAVTARIEGKSGARSLLWWGASRGVHSLQIVWEVEDDRSARLQPLFRRLGRQIVWSDPKALRTAIYDHNRYPSRNARVALAQAQRDIGRADESLELWLGLLEDVPASAAYWEGLLKTLEWYPDRPDAHELWQRALDEHPVTSTVLGVALGLEAKGQAPTAHGLLDLAWLMTPGDRAIKRARRSRNMPTALDPLTLRPWESVHDPVDGTIRVPPPVPERFTLEAAEQRGQELAREKTRIAQAAAAWVTSPEDASPPMALLYLRFGEAPADISEALTQLADEFERAAQRTPLWMPPMVADAIDDPTRLAERLRSGIEND